MKVGFLFHPPSLKPYEEFLSCFFEREYRYFRTLDAIEKISYLNKQPPFCLFNQKKLKSLLGRTVSCSFILVPRLPHVLLGLKNKERDKLFLDAIQCAEKEGVSLLTLGAFTSIVTGEGVSLPKSCSKIRFTTGNIYTAAICCKQILSEIEKQNKSSNNLVLSIIGATGSVGRLCSAFLSSRFKQVILCSRKISKNRLLELKLGENLIDKICITTDTASACKEADVCLIAVNAAFSFLDINNFKKDALVFDCSVPFSLIDNFASDKKACARIFRAGKVKFLGTVEGRKRMWRFFFPQDYIYGCLAEALILGFEERKEQFSFGPHKPEALEKMEEIFLLGEKHGFAVN